MSIDNIRSKIIENYGDFVIYRSRGDGYVYVYDILNKKRSYEMRNVECARAYIRNKQNPNLKIEDEIRVINNKIKKLQASIKRIDAFKDKVRIWNDRITTLEKQKDGFEELKKKHENKQGL